jgi:hypothetical protein
MEKLLEGGNERDVVYKKYVDETVVSVKGRQKQDLHAWRGNVKYVESS